MKPTAMQSQSQAVLPIRHAAPLVAPVALQPASSKAAGAGKESSTATPKKSFLPAYQEPKKTEAEMPLSRVLMDLFFKLILVLCIAYGAILAIRKYMTKQGLPLAGRKGLLKVIESASLGPNRSIHIVRVGNKVMVLASTPDQITAIGEIDDPEGDPSFASELLPSQGTVQSAVQGASPAQEVPSSQDAASRFSALLSQAYQTDSYSADEPGDPQGNPEQSHHGIRNLWDRVEEIRGQRGGKGTR